MHIAAILTDKGFPGQTAAFVSSAVGGGLMVGRAGSGYLLDRLFAPRVACVIFGCAAVGMTVLRMGGSLERMFAAAFCIGLALGAEVDVMAYLTSRYFGLQSFSAVYGLIFASFGLCNGLGAFLMGTGFDRTGSYSLPLTLFSIAALTGAAIMTRLGPYRYELPRIQGSGAEIDDVRVVK